jgi:hypothetical protein
MPDALVTVEELKAILGIGDLYPDTVLEQVCEAASDIVLDYLVQNRETVVQACCPESVAPPGVGTIVRFRVARPTRFQVGQSIKFGYFPKAAWTGRTLTVLEILEDDETVIRAESATVFAPGYSEPAPVIPNAIVYDAASINFYQDIPSVVEAATAIAVDIFQSRIAPGGQTEAVDFTPGPYRMGASLLSRVRGLLGRWVDTGSLVG